MQSRYLYRKPLPDEPRKETLYFAFVHKLPRLPMAECALCGARFPRNEKRILCWSHTEVIRGLQAGSEPETETPVRQPPRRGGLPIE